MWLRTWLGHRLGAVMRALRLGLLSLVAKVPLLVLTVLSNVLILAGIGLFMVPAVQTLVRAYANLHRRLAEEWSDMPIQSPYRPMPPRAPIGTSRRLTWVVTDPATWRDTLWLLAGAPVGLLLGVLPVALILYGLEGMLLIPYVIDAFAGSYGYGFIWPIEGWYDRFLIAPQGALFLGIGLAAAPRLLWVQAQFDRSLLSPTRKARLSLRVHELTKTRSDVVDAQAAELRRIERDLHDGAQARIVALSMSLGMAEDLITRDPGAARALIAEAREASGKALAELRNLVRGIHPPVLAERGLDGGVRALALTLPLPVQVHARLPGRPAAPVESAAYFAIAEALTNVVKHSGASRAWVGLDHAAGVMRITVSDDGVGGADPRVGTGLPGIQRRLAAFDGTLRVASPPGGPTVLTMELPCALSSPKTSLSSETD